MGLLNKITICLILLQPIIGYAISLEEAYSTLGLISSATEDDIKRAYRKLAMKFHPDRNRSKDAEEKFKRGKEAYEKLVGKLDHSPSTNGESTDYEALRERYEEIIELYNLSSAVFQGSIDHRQLALIQDAHEKLSRFIQLYFQKKFPNKTSDKTGQISSSNDFSLARTLKEITLVASESGLNLEFVDYMIVRIVDWTNYDPRYSKMADQFLVEYLKAIDSEARLSSFLDQGVFGKYRSSNWWRRNIRERDSLVLYKKTLYEILTGSPKKYLSQNILNTLAVYVFSEDNFQKHFNLLRDLLIQARNADLFRMAIDTLLISNTPNVPYTISQQTVDLVISVIEMGIDDRHKIRYFLEINEKNPEIFREFPRLYAILLKVSEYSSLATHTSFMDPERGWSMDNPYAKDFLDSFLKSQPAVASDIFEWNLRIRHSFTINKLYKDENERKRDLEWIGNLRSYLNKAKVLARGQSLPIVHYKRQGIETYWELLIRKGRLEHKAISCKRLF